MADRVQTFQKGNGGREVTYPLDPTTVAPTNIMVNMRPGNDHKICEPSEGIVEQARRDLAVVRVNVASGKWPGYYFEQMQLPTQPPKFFFRKGLVDPTKGEIMDQFCDMVEMDKAGELLSHVLDWLAENKVPLRKQFSVPRGSEFLFYHTNIVECYGRVLSIIMRRVGEVKYNYGHRRPEEIWNRAFAAYECPNHPEFPAWHATFAAILQAVIEYFFETETIIDEAGTKAGNALRELLLIFSHCRDLAGMHFSYSTKAGFNAGYQWTTTLLNDLNIYDPLECEKYV